MQSSMRIRVSVLLVIIGVVLAVAASLISVSSSTIQANGVIIDYGDYDTLWTEADVSDYNSVYDLMDYACTYNSISYVTDEDGSISELGGKASSETESWGAWGIKSGSISWTKIGSMKDADPSDYAVISISYTSGEEEPTVAVDYSGNSIYGYARKYRSVSLSPTVTEILASIKADATLVGVDYYSDYPQSVVQGVSDGSITVTGTYTSPNYETILGTNPDIVFCDGSQRSHYLMADTLRGQNIDSVVLYPGSDLDSVRDNIFIAGKVMQYDMASVEVIDNMDNVISALKDKIDVPEKRTMSVMVTLDPAVSPWVSGTDTYINSILEEFGAINSYGDQFGWTHISGETIGSRNPQVIIVITSEYKASQSEYDYMYNHLADQWKSTDAWKNGRVYMICEGAAEMVQRFGPRTAQTSELICRMVNPECFTEDMPLFVGDNYADYLTYSKEMNYD